MAQSVSKLETARFRGVTLPLSKCHEAGVARSGKSTFGMVDGVARFDTLWAGLGPTYAQLLSGQAPCDTDSHPFLYQLIAGDTCQLKS
jgi:hypothetical protein